VNSALLLHTVELYLNSPHHLPRLRSFCEWMQLRASQHVQQLKLQVGRTFDEGAEESAALLAAAVASCGAALTELRLNRVLQLSPFTCSSWVAALRSLRLLTIRTNDRLAVTASLQPLSALEELRLSSGGLHLPPAARLPASLTQLHLDALDGENLPGQVMPPCIYIHFAIIALWLAVGRVQRHPP
jgi:hypothetical protein